MPRPGFLDGLFSLEGKLALVTGAGSGIGRSVAQTLAAAGALVICSDVNLGAAQATADGIAAVGALAEALALDIGSEPAVEAAFAEIDARFGPLDLLVNNAGIYPKFDFLTISAEDWDRVQTVNLRGAYLCMREALKRMKTALNQGVIVNIASVATLNPVIFDNSHYGASKAGVVALTRAVALEFAEFGVRCNAVLPGGVNTEGANKHTGSGYQTRGPMMGQGRLPLRRLAEPQDIASAVLYLAAPASSYVTGQTLVVDGGFMVS